MKNPFSNVRRFFGEMTEELKKASWPTAQELRESTILVIVACMIIGLFTSLTDFSLVQFVDLFTKMVS